MNASTLEAIAHTLGGEVRGSRACFPTPGHSEKDRGSWASIVPGAPDGVLIHSANGGDPIAIKNILRDAGVLPSPGERSGGVPWNPPARETGKSPLPALHLGAGQQVVASFEYVDEGGKVLYRKHRIEPGENGRSKCFRYDHVDDQGAWKSGAGERRVPYRLLDLLAAPNDLPVYMTEGEAKADKLASWGLLATSFKEWKGREFGQFIKGRRVYILPDHDESGRAQRDRACHEIEVGGGEAIVVELPGLPKGGDILDWNGSADDLQALVRDLAKQGTIPTLDLLTLAKYKAKAKEFAIAPLAPVGEVTLFTGKGSVGKSLLGQQLATAAAMGSETLGLMPPAMNSLYITCEDDANELHWRQEHICEALDLPMESLAHKLHVASLRGELNNELATFSFEGVIKPTAAYNRLRDTLLETGAGIVFLDNVAHLFPGNENDRHQVASFVNLLNRLAGETNAAIVLLGHPNKIGDSYSGSTAWLNQVRSHFFVEHDHDTDMRTLTISKANYTRNGYQVRFFWRDGAFVGESELAPREARELMKSQRAVQDSRLFLDCLRQITREGRTVSDKSCKTYAPFVFADMPEAKSIGKARLEKAMSLLFREGKIERAELGRGSDRHRKFGLQETA